MTRRAVAAVIVTYNSALVIQHLLESLACATDVSVRAIIVDNNSSDETLRIVKRYERLPIVLVEGKANVGFGAGVNRAVRQVSRDELVLVVNPDVTFGPHLLAALCEALEKQPALAAITPALVNASGVSVSTARRFPSALDIATRRIFEVASPDGGIVRADWLCGAFMLWRAGVLQSLGGFDERYFLFYEDMDLCLRASRRGWQFGLESGRQAVHAVGHSHHHSSGARRMSRKSRRAYASRHLGRRGSVAAIFASGVDHLSSTVRGIARARLV